MRAGIIVILALPLLACGEKPASQEALKSLGARLETAEGDIENIQKTVKYTKEIQEWEATQKKEADRRAADLARLRQGEQQIERSQQMLCDATGDC